MVTKNTGLSRNLFISIDGVDGVGKTTVAKLFAANCQFQYHKSPSGPFVHLRKEIDDRANPIERYCFYRLATQFDSLQIGRSLLNGSVICDRYIASTAAYHFAMDRRISAIHNDDGLLKPDFAFHLGARSGVRDERIISRAKTLSDIRLERDSTFLDKVAEIFMSFNLIFIDTSDITIEEVVVKMRRIIAQGKSP